MPAPTNWRNRIGLSDVTEGWEGAPIWPWLEGQDDQVPIDVSMQLEENETITSASARLFMLRTINEDADVEQPSKIKGSPVVSGTTILTRLSDLQRGRYYRLEVLHGPAGNRRGRSIVIGVQE